jgi:mycothiol synthase
VADFLPLPEGCRSRPLHPDDIDPIVALLAAAEPLDDSGENEDADDLRLWFLNDRVDLDLDTRVVVTDAGEVVAQASVVDLGTHREAYAPLLTGRVAVEHRGRGIGRALLAWQLDRSRELHAERRPDLPGRFAVPVPAAHVALERLVRRSAMEPVQFYFHMNRPLTDLPPVAEVDGIRLVPYERSRDDEVRRAHNASFAEHFGVAERDAYAWQTWFTGQRSFRPRLSRLALAGDAVVGYVLVYEHEADTAATGVREAYLGQIGVLPEARGRGIASAAVAAALQAAAADGLGRAGLQVDCDNTTGALGLYEGLGFATHRRETVWARLAPAANVDLPREKVLGPAR